MKIIGANTLSQYEFRIKMGLHNNSRVESTSSIITNANVTSPYIAHIRELFLNYLLLRENCINIIVWRVIIQSFIVISL